MRVIFICLKILLYYVYASHLSLVNGKAKITKQLKKVSKTKEVQYEVTEQMFLKKIRDNYGKEK